MFIIARGGATYARLRFNAGPGGEMRCTTAVDFHRPFAGADQLAWQAEYDRYVQPTPTHSFWPDDELEHCLSPAHERDIPPHQRDFSYEFFGDTAWI
jgi:hypothetical protein